MKAITTTYTGYTLALDAYLEIENFCLPYGQKVLVVGGQTALQKAFNKIKMALTKMEIVDVVVLKHQCTYLQIDEVVERYQQSNIDMVFAVGGGKACDSGKTIADKLNLPVFTFPTIVSNCAATSAMSVIYKLDNTMDEFYFLKRGPIHCFMDASILLQAPATYFKAGVADTIAKYYETNFASRNDELEYKSALGVNIAALCLERIKKHLTNALESLKTGVINESFTEVVLTVIVNTGLVSALVNDDYNCALAHSICYGLDSVTYVEEKFLHGNLVGYGLLIQAYLDQDYKAYDEILEILNKLESPTTLKQLGLNIDNAFIKQIIDITLDSPDLKHIGYKEELTYSKILRIMEEVENKQLLRN